MERTLDHKSMERAKKKNVQAILGLLKMKTYKQSESVKHARSQKNGFQRNVLNDIFKITRFPSKQTRDDLALLLNHTSRGIQIWFQNQRNNKSERGENNYNEYRGKRREEKELNGTIDLIRLVDIIEHHLPSEKKIHWESVINHASHSS